MRQSSVAYYENTFRAGDFWGVTFTHGGSSEATRIVLAGYPGERPKIDQHLSSQGGGGTYGGAGIFVYGSSYISIRNFEIVNAPASGIVTEASATRPSYINIEQNYIHDMVGTSNPNNIGAIRTDDCMHCDIRYNVINNMGDYDSINGFHPAYRVIEYNLITNGYFGVQLKQADNGGLQADIVRNNIFVNLSGAAFHLQNMGAGTPAPQNSAFYNNLVYNVATGINCELADAGTQASALTVYNNTFVNAGDILSIDNFIGVQVYNNIYAGNSSSYGSNFIYNSRSAGSWLNQVDLFDNQLYYNVAPNWQIETYNNPLTYNTLASWQTATREITTPDLKSIFTNPLFATASPSVTKLLAGDTSDFALQSGSPALTMSCSDTTKPGCVPGGPIGAIQGQVKVGPN